MGNRSWDEVPEDLLGEDADNEYTMFDKYVVAAADAVSQTLPRRGFLVRAGPSLPT